MTSRKEIQIEKRLTTLEVEVREIKENHLAHISADIKEVKDILVSHIRDEEHKIENIKLGVPAWFTVVVGIFSALVVYFITH